MSADPLEVAQRWSEQLPRVFAHRLAAALRVGSDAVAALRMEAVLPVSAAAVRTALEVSACGDGPYLAGLLLGRLSAADGQPTVTPVWTGPLSGTVHSRLTVAVLADLVAEAQQEILLVSYATIPSQNVVDALRSAEGRGVAITLLLERPQDNPQFNGHTDPLPGLRARRLCWPADQRLPGASMHAKLLVVDRRVALLGSANLTSFGLERNLECGVLIRGGRVPGMLAEHVLTAHGLRNV